ncbi:hypothetical protein QCA50_002022 [Cerrena zonata]|uniref:Uncharacterized protein n=1 Tax=Cerrena zonata TaxID=2478898 RepID=A0AAW0GUN9_9APHY
MSPTCTIPYEVLLEFINDTPDCVTLQVFRQEDGTQTGAMLLVHEEESISLVLTAGCLYQYGLRQRGKEVNVSVKVWQDVQFKISTLLSASSSQTVQEDLASKGVKITWGRTSPGPRHRHFNGHN